jgi:choline dehydrogenase-like flavoprotein
MDRLTNRQRLALEALCRTIVPAAFENERTADLASHVAARIGDLSSYQQQRATMALRLFASRVLTLLVLGRAVPFASLGDDARSALLAACAVHRIAAIRLLLSSVRRLILHTHYGRPESTPPRQVEYAWEGPITRPRTSTRQVPPGVSHGGSGALRTRVCIIGSGVGGAMAAAILAEAGHDVVILEDGGYYTAADFGEDETHALRTLYADGGLRSTDALNVSILQGRCAGGGSTVNWMVMLRTPEWVIDEWQREHGTEDMDSAAMRAAFEQFERDSNVHPVPDEAHSPANRVILDGAAKLGWSAHAASINTRDCMRIGSCGLGCPYDAKQGALLTYLPRALNAGARLICDARVHGIARKGTGYRVSAGALTVDADIVILAAGAVGTPTLLQRSSLAPRGTGRNLRLHPTTAVVGIYDHPMYAATGIPLTTYCDEFVRLDGDYGHWIETPPFRPGLAAVALPGFGEPHRRYMRQFPNIAPLIILARDGAPTGPSVGSVTLRGGDPRIDYRLGSADRESLLHGMESAARLHFACGAQSVLTLHGRETLLTSLNDLEKIRAANASIGDPALFSAHVNGTARIGRDPRTSACRPDGQVHGHTGLYVMDGSLLPSAPGVNPHETIAAVTMILAGKLAGEM